MNTKPKKIFIRTDASITIGTGHVRRCLIIAEKLKFKGLEAVFICRNLSGNLAQFIGSFGFKVILLDDLSEPPKDAICPFQLEDAFQTSTFLQDNDYLFIDHYGLDKIFEVAVRDKLKVSIIVLDDLLNRHHQCDFFIDYMPFKRNHDYFVNDGARKFLGLDYLLIRQEFINARKNIKSTINSVKNILVFLGGNDPDNITDFVLTSLSKEAFKKFNIIAVLGDNCPHIDFLRRKFFSNQNISIQVQVKNMAEILLDTDIAIASGGTNTWERLYLGVPSIVFQLADNQKDICDFLIKEKLCAYYGDIFHLENSKFEEIFDEFISNVEFLCTIKNRSLAMMQSIGSYDAIP